MRGRRDRTSVIALVVTLLAGTGAVIAAPALLPPPLRQLVGLGPHRVAPPASVAGGGAFSFLTHQPGRRNDPVGYDPCKRIAIQVNLDGAPEDSLALVKQAMSRVEDATGLRFDYGGTTSKRPHWENQYVPTILGGVRTSPALVSWATAEEVHELAGQVVGVGGSAAVAADGGREEYVTGGVTLDADDFAALDKAEGGRREELAIMLHEFGHLVGLGHVDDRSELMYPDTDGSVHDYGPGDLAGLARVGAVPCV